MKSLKGGLALAALLMAMPAAQAEFVVDNFTGAADTGFADTTRSGVSLVGGAVFGGVSAGTLAITTTEAGGGADWSLNFVSNTTGVLNAGMLGYNHFLRLGGLNVSGGDWTLTVTATGAGGNVPGSAAYAIAEGTPETILDLTALSNVGNLNGLTSLDFSLRKDAAGLGQFVVSNIAAVPEPTSIALLGLTGLGGVVIARRRRKVEEAA